MSRKKWTVQKLNKDLASTIAERYSIDPLTALLLTQRGFDTFDKLDEFFDDSEEWIDPFLLPDMDKADLFPSVQKDGALPRKTFSMGHAEDKRYYMEVRAIQ